MRRHFCLLVCAVCLTGCASAPPPPDWLVIADTALRAHAEAWLKGERRAATRQLALARQALARTGRAEDLAHAALHACAVRIAARTAADCPEFLPLAAEATHAQQAYHAYLTGQPFDAQALNAGQRTVWLGQGSLASLDDPLARLLAASRLLDAGRLDDGQLATVLDTVAERGWPQAALPWLKVLHARQGAAGDGAGLAATERRIERIRAVLGDTR